MADNRKPSHISQEDWDAVDSPELTEDFVKGMRPAREAAPELVELQKRTGRPKAAETKTAVSIRLSPRVIAEFKKLGGRWQTRINQVLEEYVARTAPAKGKRRAAKKATARKAVARKRA